MTTFRETLDTLSLIERMPASEAGPDRLAIPGGRPRRVIERIPDHDLREARSLIRRTFDGDRWAALAFNEAMSTSDFPLIFGDTIDRMLLGAYAEFPSDFEAFVKVATVRDFRSVSRYGIDGAEGQLTKTKQGAEYREVKLDESRDQYAVEKYGQRLPLLWEDLINDDLDAFRDIPLRHGRAARRTEWRQVTELFVGANGPHTSLYKGDHKNQIIPANGAQATNPALSVSGLQDAFTVIGKMVDKDSEPIMFDGFVLVVPPALEVTARNILNATEIRPKTEGGSTTAQELITRNWMAGRLTLVVDPYIPIVASTANGSTSWFLFARATSGRPALEFGRLRGHEQPEVWVKSPNALRVGGGTVGPESGDFDTDSIAYRVRHVMGGAQLINTGGFRSTVASNGSGA